MGRFDTGAMTLGANGAQGNLLVQQHEANQEELKKLNVWIIRSNLIEVIIILGF